MNMKKHQIKQKKKIQYLKNYYSHTEISHQFQLRKKNSQTIVLLIHLS